MDSCKPSSSNHLDSIKEIIKNIVDIKKKQPKKEKVYGPTKPLPEGFAEKFKKWGLSKNYE